MRRNMNCAVVWVTPSNPCSLYELTRCSLFATIQTAISHRSKPIGESSKIVPALGENCFRQLRHFQMRRVEI
jgi:hypothetical protein